MGDTPSTPNLCLIKYFSLIILKIFSNIIYIMEVFEEPKQVKEKKKTKKELTEEKKK